VPILADHILVAILATLFPVWGATFGFRRLMRARPEALPHVRVSVYRIAIALQWTLTAAVVALWLVARPRRSWGPAIVPGLGLAPALTWGLLGVTIGVAIAAVALVRQRRRALADDEALARVRGQMRRRGLELMLPHTREELSVFAWLAVTAGVCEETLYRGYLIWYLGHYLALLPAAGIAAVLFGCGHTYQGWRGILLTSLVGAFLAAIYLVTGSLLAPIAIHALMDLHSGHIAYVAFERERAAIAAVGWEVAPPAAEPGEETSYPPAPPAAEHDLAPDAAPLPAGPPPEASDGTLV